MLGYRMLKSRLRRSTRPGNAESSRQRPATYHLSLDGVGPEAVNHAPYPDIVNGAMFGSDMPNKLADGPRSRAPRGRKGWDITLHSSLCADIGTEAPPTNDREVEGVGPPHYTEPPTLACAPRETETEARPMTTLRFTTNAASLRWGDAVHAPRVG